MSGFVQRRKSVKFEGAVTCLWRVACSKLDSKGKFNKGICNPLGWTGEFHKSVGEVQEEPSEFVHFTNIHERIRTALENSGNSAIDGQTQVHKWGNHPLDDQNCGFILLKKQT